MFNPYTKAILGAVVVFLSAIASAWDDSVLTTTEIITAVGLGIAALGLIWGLNPTLKWIMSGVLAGVSALAIALQDDAISAQEWVTIGIAVFGALAVVKQVSNTQPSSAPSN